MKKKGRHPERHWVLIMLKTRLTMNQCSSTIKNTNNLFIYLIKFSANYFDLHL